MGYFGGSEVIRCAGDVTPPGSPQQIFERCIPLVQGVHYNTGTGYPNWYHGVCMTLMLPPNTLQRVSVPGLGFGFLYQDVQSFDDQAAIGSVDDSDAPSP
jgi:hypothetical protein